MEEIWKDIKNFEGYYQVSNLGNVRSLDRYVYRRDTRILRKGRMCKKYLTTDKYYQVKLSKNGKDKRYFIHRLVAQSFIEDKDYKDGWEVNHIDFNRINNVVTNLEWKLHKDNIKHSANFGRMKHFGKDNPNYGNRTLHQKYLENPEMAMLQSRKGSKNGMAKKVILIYPNGNTQSFGYIRECSEYLTKNNMVKAKTSTFVANKISKLLNTDLSYCGYKFKN